MGRDWNRLGRLLVARRVDLDRAYTNRTRFFEDKGVRKSQQRLLVAMELCERQNFSQPTFALAEQVYGWKSGSVEAVLDGGDPIPVEASDLRVRRDRLEDIRSELHRLINRLPDDSLPDALEWLRDFEHAEAGQRQPERRTRPRAD